MRVILAAMFALALAAPAWAGNGTIALSLQKSTEGQPVTFPGTISDENIDRMVAKYRRILRVEESVSDTDVKHMIAQRMIARAIGDVDAQEAADAVNSPRTPIVVTPP